jgi:hypothetical protein
MVFGGMLDAVKLKSAEKLSAAVFLDLDLNLHFYY